MNSQGYPTDRQVLEDLGAPFIQAFIGAVEGAKDDAAALRAWQPGWSASFSNRFTANFLHERIWDRLVRAVDGFENIEIIDDEPTRQMHHGTRYLMRIKRHHVDDQISAYPTDAALSFWMHNTPEPMFEGMEQVSLALGYLWDRELRVAGEPVMSFRDGMKNPIWAITLQRATQAATGFSWAPIAPQLPDIDLSGIPHTGVEEVGS